MRTKILVLAAAALAAGLVSSQAQVYSANIVGYVNIVLLPGLNLVTAPLKGTAGDFDADSINTVLVKTTPVLDGGCSFLPWDPNNHVYNPSPAVAGGDGYWYNDTYEYFATNTVTPGEGFFINCLNTTNVVLTMVGEVSMTNAVTEVAGLGFYGDAVPAAVDLATNGFPITVTGSSLKWWDAQNQAFSGTPLIGVTAEDLGGDQAAFMNEEYTEFLPAIPNVGQGFIYQNLDENPSVWNRGYTNSP
jgi:hypothetical protein